MADNIRQFRSRDSRRSAAAERELQKKVKKHRRGNRTAVLSFVIVAVLLITYFYVDHQRKEYSIYTIVDWTELDGMGGSEVASFGGSILRYNKDGVSYVDYSNEQIWNYSYEMQAPMIDVGNKTAAIADKGGNRIYLLNKEGMLGQIETLLPIQKICVSDANTVAVLLKDGDVSRVYYYNASGELISEMKIGMDNMGYPLAMDLAPDGNLFMLSFVSVNGGKLESVISYYNFGNVGQEYQDRLVKSKKYENTLFPVVEFLNDNISVAYGDNMTQIFEGDEIPEEREAITYEDQVQSVFSDENHIGLVFENIGGSSSYRTAVYKTNGNLEFEQEVSAAYSHVKIDQDKVIFFNESEMEIYSMSGVRKFAGEYDAIIKDIIATNKQSRYIVITTEELDRIKLD